MGNRADLVPQMRYSGKTLVPTGMLVLPHEYLEPNPQDQPQTINFPDPRPVLNPRPDPMLWPLNNSKPYANPDEEQSV